MLHNLHKFVMIKKMLPSSFNILYAFRLCSPFSLLVLFFIRLSWLLLSTEMIKRDCCAMHGGRFS